MRQAHFRTWEGAGELSRGGMTARSHPDLPPSHPGDPARYLSSTM